jgi:hypothetical protein
MLCACVTEHHRLTPLGTDYSTIYWQRQHPLLRARWALGGNRAGAFPNLPPGSADTRLERRCNGAN